ncbi:MAG: hypothetical protein KGJ60_00120 [Verrucomicrobiota bacterium]|nr:hypothetical protein [Verrucomicrobiota bacterium]
MDWIWDLGQVTIVWPGDHSASGFPAPWPLGQSPASRLDQVNGAFEPPRETLAGTAAQMLEHGPEEFLGQVRRAHLVGMGEIVAAGRGRAADAGERCCMQTQGVADIVESDAVRQLGKQAAFSLASSNF